jgi:hypothetical protein
VAPKVPAESYLGFLYALEEVAVYGYVTPLKLKIVLALALSDAVVRDADVISVRPLLSPVLSSTPALILPSSQVFKALHWAYYRAAANPFLKLNTPLDSTSTDNALVVGSPQWASFRRRVDEVARASGALLVDSSSQ